MSGALDGLKKQWDRARSEVGAELRRQAVLGSYELAGALWSGSAYKGDLGLLTSQKETNYDQMLSAKAAEAGVREQDKGQDKGEGVEI